MSATTQHHDVLTVEADLTSHFFSDHPAEAAHLLEEDGISDAGAVVGLVQPAATAGVVERMLPHAAARLLLSMNEKAVSAILEHMIPNRALAVLGIMEEAERDTWIDRLEPAVAAEFRALMTYDLDSAGRLMDTRAPTLRDDTTVGRVLEELRTTPSRTASSIFLSDENGVLSSRVTIQDLAVADHDQPVRMLARPLVAAVNTFAPRSEVAKTLETYKLYDLPVVDLDGRLVGIVYHSALVEALQETSAADIQTMVGVSKDERALSPALFAVRKRLPWLQVNLLTAFLAASVVGLFEATIAAFTALAVLLPVVAGQSGNSGSQALAVTIRGLALREITPRQWFRVMRKEVATGLINGVAIAVTCGIGVYFWSGSAGLVVVIMVSMVLAMVAAGFAGALVPITLTRLGQDPAQSSSIILTTVTDVAGFFSFLGIATLMLSML